eukprot:TRINITY_DN1663_c2_g1_i1.p2 TRINITY_DN1663_c2_g1~~TRINITY_DN1663_c2_g1_i1.p2  ORF type:complete len:249 (+),score=86.35 TRINITY_DN1663_c2_g1_i1:89-835(+)
MDEPDGRGLAQTMVCGKSNKFKQFKSKNPNLSLVPVDRERLASTTDDGCALPRKLSHGANSDMFATRVLPWLYLGAAYDANREEQLKKYNITHIVNLQRETETKQWKDIDYLHISVNDHSDAPIERYFDQVIQWLEKVRVAKGVALVHCRQGISRSATMTIAYLMHLVRCPYKLAHDVVRRQRPGINPNLGFVSALETFQERLSIDLEAPYSNYKEPLSDLHLFSPLTDNRNYNSPPGTPRSPKTAHF